MANIFALTIHIDFQPNRLIFLLGANRPRAKRLGVRNDQGRNDLGRNAAGAKRLGGEQDLGRNDPDSDTLYSLAISTSIPSDTMFEYPRPFACYYF